MASTMLEALSKLAWPVLAATAFFVLYPVIKRMIESRCVTIKIGNMELTVQDATEQMRKQLEDLQAKVSELREHEGVATGSAAAPKVKANVKSVLWVNDKPTEGAYEIALLQDKGATVQRAVSTTEAMRMIMSGRAAPDAIVSDMGRREEGEYRSNAGILLIKQVRRASFHVPIVLYASPKYQEKNQAQAIEAGGTGAVSTAVELFELLGVAGLTAEPSAPHDLAPKTGRGS